MFLSLIFLPEVNVANVSSLCSNASDTVFHLPETSLPGPLSSESLAIGTIAHSFVSVSPFTVDLGIPNTFYVGSSVSWIPCFLFLNLLVYFDGNTS